MPKPPGNDITLDDAKRLVDAANARRINPEDVPIIVTESAPKTQRTRRTKPAPHTTQPPPPPSPPPITPTTDKSDYSPPGPEIYVKRGMGEHAELYGNRDWRMSNLYYLVDKNAQVFKFSPNPEQRVLMGCNWYSNLVLKGRQFGGTSIYCISYLDTALWMPNIKIGIIAQDDENVKKVFREKILFPYENLDKVVREAKKARTESANELLFNNNSSISVRTSFRSGTLNFLHVTEIGKICRRYPLKADEIMAGSMQTVGPGMFRTMESTADGNIGYFPELFREAAYDEAENKWFTWGMNGAPPKDKRRAKSPLSWRPFFFEWFHRPEYTIFGWEDYKIPDYEEVYFKGLEDKYDIYLEQSQKVWYCEKKKELGVLMRSEYPMHPGEAFDAEIKGAYYAEQMDWLYQNGRITHVPYDPAFPVFTSWDIGLDDYNVILFWQFIGREVRGIDCYLNNNLSLLHYLDYLKSMKYRYALHVAPHDIKVREYSNATSRWQTAKNHGVRFYVAPKMSLADGINSVRLFLMRCVFDSVKFSPVIKALQLYRKKLNPSDETFLDIPEKGDQNHPSDAVRYMAVTDQIISMTKYDGVWGTDFTQDKKINMPNFSSRAWS